MSTSVNITPIIAHFLEFLKNIKCNAILTKKYAKCDIIPIEVGYMNKEIVSPRITEFKFLLLYVATTLFQGDERIINKDQLEAKLLNVYDDERYKFLFEDICISGSIESKRVNLGDAFQKACVCNLLIINSDGRYIIGLTEKEAAKILATYNGYETIMMAKLIETIYPTLRYNRGIEHLNESMRDYITYLKNLSVNDPEEAKRLANEALLRTGVINEDGSMRSPQLEKINTD